MWSPSTILDADLVVEHPSKIRTFAWRLGYNLLPTNAKIASINQCFNNLCLQCSLKEEMLVHTLRDCGKAKETLACGGVDELVLTSDWDTE